VISRVAGVGVALALAGAALAQGAPDAGPVTVIAARGHGDAVAAALRAAALPVVRRSGATMQVNAPAGRIAAIGRLPGVAAAYPAPGGVPATDPEEDPGAKVTPVAGPVLSEGLERIGADALQSLARDGRGVTIAVLDLGFGPISRMVGLQRRKELPPSSRLETASFDPAWGFAGRNAYGNPTNHGELVAQTVYDFAPAARYMFVNYHTEQDFQAAVDWLIARRPDVVVHSNSFLEGPFDGTGAAAQAVDRAAAAGIAWVNSAGNYAERHWEGTWADADGDEVLDWPRTPGWSFAVAPGKPITFALSWDQPEGAEVTDLDLVLEKLTPGGWAAVAASRDSQLAGAPPAERLTGIPSGDGGQGPSPWAPWSGRATPSRRTPRADPPTTGASSPTSRPPRTRGCRRPPARGRSGERRTPPRMPRGPSRCSSRPAAGPARPSTSRPSATCSPRRPWTSGCRDPTTSSAPDACAWTWTRPRSA